MSFIGKNASLRTGLLVLLLIVIALAAALPTAVGWLIGGRAARQGADARLAASLSGFRVQQPDRLQKIELMARVLATDPVLTGYLQEAVEGGDGVKLLDLLEGYQDRLAFDVAAVFDTAHGERAAIGASITDAATLATTLETARDRDRARGIWRDGTSLYHAAALPVVRDFELLGFVVVALAVDDALARQLASLGSDTVLFAVIGSGGNALPVGGTAPPAQAAELIDALVRRGDVLTNAVTRGETVASVHVELPNDRVVAGIEPLRDAAGQAVGAVIATAAPSQSVPGLSRLPLAGIAGMLAGLVLGGLGIAWLTDRSQRPWRSLAAYTRGLAAGEESSVPGDLPGEAGDMAAALDRLTSDRRQQRALAIAVTASASQTLSGGGGDARQRAEASDVTLMAAELRRFADPKLGYDAEANLERFVTDLRRLRAAVRERQGHIVSVAGHQVLAQFDGDGAAFRALSAAAEASRSLAEGESVFDQPEPPVIALAAGTVVRGRVAWGSGAGAATLGLPLQQLESLLREGTPGEIYLPKQVYAELAPAFAQAGAERQPQRGVMSPQPLYAVPSEVAVKVTGAGTPSAMDTAPGERKLADVAVGTTLAHRFEILEEKGADSQSVRFAVRDRERGVVALMALLRPQLIASAEDLERLATAFRRLRGLDHPHVVTVWDFGEAERLPYVLMPFVAGERLRAILGNGPLRPAAVLGMARQLAAGLVAAHAAGIVHGDVRPEHVMIDGAGHVRIGGFAVGGGGQAPPASGYRSPERMSGMAGSLGDDIYGFGATLYESLAGRPAFSGATPADIHQQQMAGPPPPLSQLVEVPAPLAALIEACLSRDPEARPASFEALAASLDPLRAV